MLSNGLKLAALTFSKPQNLSLPSSRIGPDSNKCFSKALIWGPLASFFEGDEPVEGLDVPCDIDLVSHMNLQKESPAGTSML